MKAGIQCCAGWDSVRNLPENEAWKPHCHYGGLHLWGTAPPMNVRMSINRICSTVKQEAHIPFARSDISSVYVEFTTYPGYSSGHFSLSFTPSPCDRSFIFYGCTSTTVCETSSKYPFHKPAATRLTGCQDLWYLKHEYSDESDDDYWHYHHSNESLHSHLKFGIESLAKVSIESWTLLSLPSFVTMAEIRLLLISINITTVKAFPFDLYTFDIYSLTIKPFEQRILTEAHLQSITTEMSANVNNQILRLRLHRNLICSLKLMNVFLNGIQHVFLDYWSRLIPWENIIDLGYCNVWVPVTSRIPSLHIHRWFLYSDSQHIVAKLVPKKQCETCSLNVTIVENLRHSRSARYTRWIDVTGMEWYTSCPAFKMEVRWANMCGNACELLLQFHYFQKRLSDDRVLSSGNTIYDPASTAVRQTWNDVNEMCMNSLPKFTRDTKRAILNSALQKIGWYNPFRDIFFVGLYKETTVGNFYVYQVLV